MSGSDESVTAIELVDPLVGTIFDKRFRVDERIAAGGFGAIYRATHVKSGHQIALKVLHPTLASDIGVLARFRREGTTLTSLRNPHTITAYEFGQADRTLFIVLELLHGESLFEHYSLSGPMEWRRVVHIAKQVCESLEEAHAQGIIHRDLKPTNIHLEHTSDDPDYVKVLDFGIAKIVRGSEHDSQDITNVGQMIGTLDYMSPEQMVGGQVTGQTDIYTLGIVMYEMIAGTRPFPESTTATGALAAMLRTTPEPLYLRSPIPRELDMIVMRCLERETQRRYRSVGELRAELERVVADAVPVATATVMVPKGTYEDDETSVTPPPERVLEVLRQSKDPLEDSIETRRTPKVVLTARPPGKLDVNPMANTELARAPRAPTSDAMNTPKLEVRGQRAPVAPLEWDDNDERAATTTRRPEDTPARAMASPAARRGDEPRRKSSPSIPPTPVIRPLEARHISTPVPQIVVAPFSQRTPPQDPRMGVHARPRTPTGQVPPLVGPDGQRIPTGPMAPYAAPPPYSQHVPTPGPFPGFPPTPMPTPMGPGMPPTPMGQQHGRLPTAGYDMGQMAARDAAMGRLIWIVVLVVAAGVGFLIATQL